MVDTSTSKRDRVIVIMAAIVATTAASAAITGGVTDKDYSLGQQVLTQAGQDEQMLVLSMLGYDQGDTETANFLYTQVSQKDPTVQYSKDDVKTYYKNTIPSGYVESSLFFVQGDSYRDVSHYLIAISAAVSGGIAAFTTIFRSKDGQDLPVKL